MLGVIESFKILNNLPIADFAVLRRSNDLKKVGFPCYLKADVVGHKTEVGAVLKCNNFEEAGKNLKKMQEKFFRNDLIVQESFPPRSDSGESDGIEMIVGLKSDEVFGTLLVVGFGGIFAEVKKDVSFRALPVSRKDIIEMIRELDGVKVFFSRKKYGVEKFVELVEKVSKLGGGGKIKEMDLNPVIVGEKQGYKERY